MAGSSSKSPQPWTSDRHPTSTAALISSLKQLRQDNPKAVRPNVHHYPASIYSSEDKGEGPSQHRDRRITSWKMTEHMYFNPSNNFPTLARGLFTEEVEDGDPVPNEAEACEGEWEDSSRERIVARGYDKFFNIDEVEWTSWDAMRKHTQPPYQLTLKSNGCLILISALSPSHILVASKHSLGTTTEAQEARDTAEGLVVNGIERLRLDDGKTKSKGGESEKLSEVTGEAKEAQAHAEVGRSWVKRTLDRSGKTEKDLAQRLWDSNLTAVLELCDDSFEEHVLATPEHWTGLHLHGLNHNTPHFSTASPAQVTSFASDFGFIPTKYVELNTLDEVKHFTDEVASKGSWEGDEIEGFVVRCTVADASGPGKPPYRPGAPFFFKIKFDEPYLMYRQWREMTRTFLATKQEDRLKTLEKKGRALGNRSEHRVYVNWLIAEWERNPRLFDDYGRGVVKVRDRFLQWTEKDGAQEWAEAKENKNGWGKEKPRKPERDLSTLPKKYMLVPVAVPGCGKTLVGIALSRLFGFGHTQSDDVTAKRSAPTFLKNIAGLLQKNDVVYADRNNHIDKHYQELSNLANDKSLRAFNVRRIAMIWDVKSLPYHRIVRICSERVVKRGDNHQTLRPDLTAEAEHEAVVGQFLRNWTEPDPDDFDDIIMLNVQETPEQSLNKIVEGLVKILGVDRPSNTQITDALKSAEEYKVTTPYHAPAIKSGKPIRYFGVAPEVDLPETLDTILHSDIDAARQHLLESASSFYHQLRSNDRLTAKPHITLAHEKSVAAAKEAREKENESTPSKVEVLWDTCKALAEMEVSPMYSFNITLLVWDDRVMALALDGLKPFDTTHNPELVLPEEVALHLHVTVGTKDEEIPAFESRGIVRVAREAIESGNRDNIAGEAVEGGGKVRWLHVEGLKSEGRVRGMY